MTSSNSHLTELVKAEQCPPGLWTTPQDSAKQIVQSALAPVTAQSAEPTLTQAEHAQLHVRVIALENLLIAILASATEYQLDCAREMAAYILPRAGATPHPLTTHAAAEMISLVERAVHFRGTPPR